MEVVQVPLLAVIFASILTVLLGWRHPRAESFGVSWGMLVFVFSFLFAVGKEWLPEAGPSVIGIRPLAQGIFGCYLVILIVLVAPPDDLREFRELRESRGHAESQSRSSGRGSIVPLCLGVLMLGTLLLLLIDEF